MTFLLQATLVDTSSARLVKSNTSPASLRARPIPSLEETAGRTAWDSDVRHATRAIQRAHMSKLRTPPSIHSRCRKTTHPRRQSPRPLGPFASPSGISCTLRSLSIVWLILSSWYLLALGLKLLFRGWMKSTELTPGSPCALAIQADEPHANKKNYGRPGCATSP